MQRLSVSLAATALALTSVACAPASGGGDSVSRPKNLTFDTESKANQAVLVIGSDQKIPGVHLDPPHVEAALLNPAYRFNFHVTRPTVSSTADEIKALAAQAAGAMLQGAEKDPNGTMALYFTGHGKETGELVAKDRPFLFDEVGQAIREARGGKAIKRLIIIVDACYSGNLVDGAGQVRSGLSLAPGVIGAAGLPNVGVEGESASRYLEALNGFADSVVRLKDGLYEELILIASSRKTELSSDTKQGGIGTNAFLTALEQLSTATPPATIRALADATVKNSTGQTPVFRLEPPELADQLLFDQTVAETDAQTATATVTSSSATVTSSSATVTSSSATVTSSSAAPGGNSDRIDATSQGAPQSTASAASSTTSSAQTSERP